MSARGLHRCGSTVTEKVRGKGPERARRRASSRQLPRGPHAEFFLEAEPDPRRWEREDPTGGLLDRRSAIAALDRIAEELHSVSRDDDEWLDEAGRLRVIVGDDRILFRLQFVEESQEELAGQLDRLFDLAFDLGHELGLELVDPLLGATHTRFRYDSSFPRILDAYAKKARTELALEREESWSELSRESEPVALPAEAPSFTAELESLPPFLWTRRVRRVGPLSLRGTPALTALSGVTRETPWIAILPAGKPVAEVALLRILRMSRPLEGAVVIEAISAGLTKAASIDVGRVRLSP